MWLLMIIIGIIAFFIIYGIIMEHIDTKKGASSSKFSTDKQQSKKPVLYPEVFEMIKLYNELSFDTPSVDKQECIRRCDEVCTEYEWQCSHRENEAWLPNAQALWSAVCTNDIYYEGTRYPHMLMSDILLKIQEKYFRF